MSVLLRISVIAVLLSLVVAVASAIVHDQELTSVRRSLSDFPSLRLRILLRGNNMQIHGQSVFDVFAKPNVSTDGSSVRYDGFATFIQGDTTFTYMLVNGTAYVVESISDDVTSVATQAARCLTSITPFDSIVEALNSLRPAPSGLLSYDSEVDCPSEVLFETMFGGEHFAVCVSRSTGFIAYGGDIITAVEYLDKPLPNISTPTLSDDVSCDEVATATSVTTNTRTLLTGTATFFYLPES